MGSRGWIRGSLVVGSFALLAGSAEAADIDVTTTSDAVSADSQCSLREAVVAANTDTSGPGGDCTAGSGSDTIILAGGSAYKLTTAPTGTDDATSGDLNLTQPVTIAGTGAASSTVDGGGLDRVFSVEALGVQIADVTITGGDAAFGDGGGVDVNRGAALTLSRSIVTANKASEGGGVSNSGAQVTVTDSTVSHNDAPTGGGGVFDNGSMTIERTQVTSNTAERAGGVYVNSGSVDISDSSVSDNGDAATTAQAGGLEIDGGPTTLTDVQVTGNVAYNVGAGILSDVRSSEPTTLTRTIVSGNSLVPPTPGSGVEGAGIWTIGALNLTDSWVHDNSAASGFGGGIFFQPRNGDEELQIEGSAIGPSNRAKTGDGIELAGTSDATSATITRSTIADNGDDLSFGHGGGIFVGPRDTATLRDVTLAENKASNSTGGGNLYAADGSAVSWQNTLVARAFGGGNCDHGTTATLTTHGGNQEYGDPDALCGFQTAAGDFVSPTDLDTTQLGALQENGGPTETMALLPGAPPLETGSGCQPTDQRGVPRPQGSACDSGAYELDTTPPAASITSGPDGTTASNAVSFTFTANEPASFACRLDSAAFSPCSSPFAAGTLADGPHTFSVRATDIAGNVGTPATRTFTIVPGGTGGGVGSGNTGGSANTGGSGVPSSPKLSGVSQSARYWREGRALPHLARASTRIGTSFSFVLSESAQVMFTFDRVSNGRRLGGRCVPVAKARRSRHRCHYLARAGVVRVQGEPQRNRLRFQGRLSRRRRLRPGSYELLITAAANGQSSAAAVLRFTILRG